jgi:tetratricopeptide (TPR) repeat protein
MNRSTNESKPSSASSRETDRPRIKRILNLRLLVETLVVAAVLGPAIYGWYCLQVKRTAAAMLERAAELAKNKDDAAAAQYYFQYLKLRPDDAGVQVLLAETFDRAVKDERGKARAVEYYYQALGVAEAGKRPELRRHLGELLLQLRRFASTEEEARELLKLDKNDAQGCRLLALALYGEVRTGAKPRGKNAVPLGDVFEQARRLNPTDIEIAVVLAAIYRDDPQLLNGKQQALSDAKRGRLADGVVDGMVAAQPKSADAYLARHRYRVRYGLPNAQDDLAAALKCGPDDRNVLLQAAQQARRDANAALRKGDAAKKDAEAAWAQARKHYEHAISVAPTDETAYLGLGDLYLEQGKPARAAETWRLGLEKCNKQSIDLNLRLAELSIAEGKLDDARAALDTVSQTIEKIGTFLPRPTKLALKRTVDLLRGKLMLSRGQYCEAISLLRPVAVGQAATNAEAMQILQARQGLGRAYGAIGQWDLSAAAYEQVASLVPKSAWPRLEAAAAWTAAGRPDTAASWYEQALAIDPASKTWLALAQVRLQRELRLPRNRREWGPVEEALSKAKKLSEKSPASERWQLRLLEADSVLVRADTPARREQATRECLATYGALEKDCPGVAGLLTALAAGYERLGRPAEADRVVQQIEKIKGQAAAACLMKAKLCISRKKCQEAREALAAGLKTLPPASHPALQSELVRVAMYENKFDVAREQLLKLHDSNPAAIEWLIQLAEFDFETAKFAELERWEKELQAIEGPEGVFWQYYKSRRLLAQADNAKDANLVLASELQSHVQNQRPTWSKAHLLRGLLWEARGKFDEAIEAYQEAIRLGERQSLAYERLVSLLTQADRLAEADHYLRLLQDQIAASETLSTLEIAVASRRGQTDRALEAARRGAERRPKDPLAHLWLGQMFLADGKTAEAEASLKKAVDLAPGDARTLGGLFQFYARTGRPDRAREILPKIVENPKLADVQRATILAVGYDLLGDKKQAEANYRRAAEVAVDDPSPQIQLAGYLLRARVDDRAEPERLLRETVRRWPDSSLARQMLAELLMDRGGEPQWREALQLVEQVGKDRQMLDVDRRAQALILARRGGRENLNKARQIFEELVGDARKAQASDLARLAQLYEGENKFDLARQQYLKLLSRDNPSAAHLAAYIELLLRHDRFAEAAEWLAKLEAIRPDDLGVAQLRSRCLHGQGKDKEIEPLVESLAQKLLKRPAKDTNPEKTKQREAELALRVGSLYLAVNQSQAAERWYRRLVESAPKRYDVLAAALAQQGRMREAIELCQKAAQSDKSANPSLALAMILLMGKPSKEDFQLAEPTLGAAAADHKDKAELLSVLASVRVVQQRVDDAAGLYRSVLKLKPTDVQTLNNLATLLGEQPSTRQEAIQYIDRAIQIVGPQPGLLDTKGMILVFDGKADKAVPLLQEAAATPQSDPRFHFHLAVACDRVGNVEKARTALKTACQGELTGQVLTPTDRQMLAELQKKYDKL